MIIKYIELLGFGSYEHLTRWEVPMGITGIVGVYDENVKKSNGSGKSTIISGITYALYGEGECTKLEELVNDRVKASKGMMSVKLGFEINGQTYEVVRGIKNGSYLDFYKTTEISEDVNSRIRIGDESTNIKETQQSIYNVLKMEYDMFSASGFFEQNKLDKFIDADPAVRRSYTDKVFDLESWRTASKSSLAILTESKNKVSDLLKQILNQETREKELEKELIKIESKQKEMVELLTQKTEKEEGFSKYDKVYPILTRLTFDQEALDKNKFSIKKYTEDIFAKYIALGKLREKLLSPLLAEEVSTYNELIEKNVISKESLTKDEAAIIDQINAVNKKVVGYSNTIASINTEIKMESERVLAGDSATCPVCRQDITQEHIDFENSKIEVRLKELKEKLQIQTAEYTVERESEKELTKKRDEIKNAISLIDVEVANLNKKIHLKEIEKLTLDKDIQSLSQDIKNVEAIKLGIEEDLIQLEEAIAESNKSIAEVFPDGKLINLEDLKNEINVINSNIVQVTKEITELNLFKKESEEIKKLIEENKSNLKINQEDLYFNELGTSLFKEIPTTIFQESIAEVETAANNIIQRVIPTLQVKIWEDLDKKSRKLMISFISNGFERSYERLSGGEKTIANIGVRLGYSQVITARANTSIDFIVLDEPFGALDEENRDLVKKIFAIMSQWFTQIIVISHDDSIENFPNVLRIGKTEDGVSYII